MKDDIKNIAASVRGRLQNKARETNRPFAEILQYYAMERFLYRFSESVYAGQFILKGALMFTAWQVPERRTTMDIDFLARFDNKLDAIEKVVKEVCGEEVVNDGLVFDPETVKGQKIKEDADYEGVRIKFRGFLERSRIPMQIDVGFGDTVYPQPKGIDYPSILGFPKPHLKGYSAETVIAEKFDAMIQLGQLNSRMKDFYDVWLLLRQFEFKGEPLLEAIQKTFVNRKTALPSRPPFFAEEIYDAGSDRQTLWKAFLSKNGIKHAPEKLGEAARIIEKFLEAPVSAIHSAKPFVKNWSASGVWK